MTKNLCFICFLNVIIICNPLVEFERDIVDQGVELLKNWPNDPRIGLSFLVELIEIDVDLEKGITIFKEFSIGDEIMKI